MWRGKLGVVVTPPNVRQPRNGGLLGTVVGVEGVGHFVPSFGARVVPSIRRCPAGRARAHDAIKQRSIMQLASAVFCNILPVVLVPIEVDFRDRITVPAEGDVPYSGHRPYASSICR